MSVLSELKVLEIASVLAGPAVGMYFAEKGAKVIKVENIRTKGDVTRSWKLSEEDKDAEISAYFCAVNWHKDYIMLDLSDTNERNRIEQLIKDSDILITNFKAGDAKKFNLDFDSVKTMNETIIHAELSGFGPDSERIAYDLVLQAETGFMSMNGTSESGPIKMPIAMIDLLAAHQLKEGILEALLERNIHPKAYHVEVSLYDSAIASLANQATNYLMADHIPQPMGSLHPNIAPYGEIFITKDNQQLTLAVGSDRQFEAVLELLGLEKKESFATNKQRVENRSEIFNLIQNKIRDWDADKLCDRLIELKVPVAKINDLKAVFEQAAAKKLVLEENISGKQTKRVKTSVYHLTSS